MRQDAPQTSTTHARCRTGQRQTRPAALRRGARRISTVGRVRGSTSAYADGGAVGVRVHAMLLVRRAHWSARLPWAVGSRRAWPALHRRRRRHCMRPVAITACFSRTGPGGCRIGEAGWRRRRHGEVRFIDRCTRRTTRPHHAAEARRKRGELAASPLEALRRRRMVAGRRHCVLQRHGNQVCRTRGGGEPHEDQEQAGVCGSES
jgi:hypothetical protein